MLLARRFRDRSRRHICATRLPRARDRGQPRTNANPTRSARTRTPATTLNSSPCSTRLQPPKHGLSLCVCQETWRCHRSALGTGRPWTIHIQALTFNELNPIQCASRNFSAKHLKTKSTHSISPPHYIKISNPICI